EGHAGMVRELAQQQPAERGLAGADLAGELHEAAAAALGDPEQQVRERGAVAFAEEDEARIRRDRERGRGEAVVLEVHGAQSVTSRDSPTARASGWVIRRGRARTGCASTAARMTTTPR